MSMKLSVLVVALAILNVYATTNNQFTNTARKSNRVNLLSQAMNARMLAAQNPQLASSLDTTGGFVPIQRAIPTIMEMTTVGSVTQRSLDGMTNPMFQRNVNGMMMNQQTMTTTRSMMNMQQQNGMMMQNQQQPQGGMMNQQGMQNMQNMQNMQGQQMTGQMMGGNQQQMGNQMTGQMMGVQQQPQQTGQMNMGGQQMGNQMGNQMMGGQQQPQQTGQMNMGGQQMGNQMTGQMMGGNQQQMGVQQQPQQSGQMNMGGQQMGNQMGMIGSQTRSMNQIPQNVSTIPISRAAMDLCSTNQAGDIIANPSNPSQFVICYGFGEFTIMDCPEHLVYNPHLVRCDLDATVPPGCSSNPCLNNGKCIDLPQLFTFRCECPSGFTGQSCEKVDTCSSKPCGPDGVCISMAAGSPIPNVCMCNSGRTIGTTCSQQSVEMNPCFQQNSNLKQFATRMNPSVFVQCEGLRPHFVFCQFPLVYSPSRQACDWVAQ